MICNHSFRAVRGGFGRSSLPSCSIHPSQIQGRSSTVLGFRMSSSKDQQHHQPQDMESKSQEQPHPIRGDMMYDSFGEGYGTRSDDEGFGGIYRGNQESPKKKEHIPTKPGQRRHEEYDASQGSEVKEKEKTRHQQDVKSE